MQNAIHIFFRFLLLLLIAAAPVLIATSCSSEDDLNAIFNGKTWYITGARINGQELTGDQLKSLYTNADAYRILFTSSTFSGALAPGSTINGTWSADGKDKTFQMNFSTANYVEAATVSNLIYNILRYATTYSGDENVLKIQQDSDNFVRLSIQRTTASTY